MIEIDPEVGKLIPISLVEREIARLPSLRVRKVLIDRYLWNSKLRAWAGYIPEVEGIVFDPTVSASAICSAKNRDWENLNLTEDEAWIFVFHHELRHASGQESEWECDRYAVERIIEMRREKMDQLCKHD